MTTIDALEAEAERHRLIVGKIESLIRDLKEISQPELAFPRNGAVESASETEAATIAAKPYRGMKQAEAIEAVLRTKGQATANEIFVTLRAGGLEIAKPSYVSAILARQRERFQHVGKRKWRLTLPQAAA